MEILGPSKMYYGGSDKPILPCGARVVIETESDIKIDNKDYWLESCNSFRSKKTL